MTANKVEEKIVEELGEKIWAYAPGNDDIDIEFNPAKVWFLDDDLEEVNLGNEGYEEGLNVTLTRDEAKQLIKDLQEWLDGDE